MSTSSAELGVSAPLDARSRGMSITTTSTGLVPWLDFRITGAHRAAAAMFYFLYYALTAVHALHLTIAIVVVGLHRASARRRRRPHRQQIVVAGLYWHFVDGMWVLLYTLIYVASPRS